MKPVLILADIHIGLQKNNIIWHKVVWNLFTEIHDVCHKNGITDICILGDFFHDRKSINIKSIELAMEIAKLLKPFQTYIIVGNHDSFYNSKIEPTSLSIFSEYKNIHIIKEPYIYKDEILMVPWLWNGSESYEKGIKYLFGHFAFNGFYMNNYKKCERGLNKEMVSSFEHVYTGHFHGYSENGNITYLGSPYQQTFNDVGDKRGYYLFDGSLIFFEFKDCPKFIKYNTKDILDPSHISGNIVKLIYDKDYGTNKNNEILEEVQSLSPLQLHTDFSNVGGDEEDMVTEELVPGLLDHNEIIEQYIKNVKLPSNIKKKVLIEMMEKMLKEEKE